MSELRLTPKARAKFARNMRQAQTIGEIENIVYIPFEKAWAWFKTKKTLHGILFAIAFYLVLGLIGSFDSPTYY